MKRPNYSRTYTYIKRLADLVTFGKIAQLAGKEIQTAEAWGREPESNDNPFGTGKRNPLDCVLRLIALAHRESPALAHEMADLFPDYVAFLDRRALDRDGACLNELIGSAVKEHADAVVSLLNECPPDYARAFTEIKESQVALSRLELCVKEELKAV